MSDSTNNASSIVITAIGAVAAIGGSAEQCAASIKAGITPFAEHGTYLCEPEDPEWDEDLPAYVAAAPFIDLSIDNIERFGELALPALKEVFSESQLKRASLKDTGLFISLPDKESSLSSATLNQDWLASLLKRTGLVGLAGAHVAALGKVGVFSLIHEATKHLQSGKIKQCIVGGVDSYLLPERMKFYDQLWRLKSSRNVDGFIPGEASIMINLETRENAESRGVEILAEINGLGFGVEKNNFFSEKSSTGEGLTEAIRSALKNDQNRDIKIIESDLSGESYYSQELGLVHTRLGQTLNSIEQVSHPADCCGEVGAAAGGLLILDVLKNKFGEEKSQEVILTTANDDGRRSVLLLKSV